MKTLVCFAFAVLAMALATNSASAYERGCKAKIYIKKGDLALVLDHFSARWVDFNNPNDARRKARSKAKLCATQAFKTRWERRKPAECTHLGTTGVFDYNIHSIKDRIERVACAIGRDKGTFEVRLSVSGDKGCGMDEKFMSYDMTADMCARLGTWEFDRDRGGENYKNFDLKQAYPGLCQDACKRESRCRAWTYVNPEIQGPNARCWLKTKATSPRLSNCCVSGVK